MIATLALSLCACARIRATEGVTVGSAHRCSATHWIHILLCWRLDDVAAIGACVQRRRFAKVKPLQNITPEFR